MKSKTSLRSFLALAGSALLAVSSANANQTWDGGGTNGDWNNATNWGLDALPVWTDGTANTGPTTIPISFGGVLQTTTNNDLPAGTAIEGITLTNNGTAGKTSPFTLQGNSISLGIANNNGITTTAITTGGPIEDIIKLNIDFNSGTGNRIFNAALNHNLKVEGVISGASGYTLLKQGVGKLTLTNANNSYAGATNITGGGMLEITSIANGGVGNNSSIGASTNAAANLQFSFGVNSALTNTLRYVGSTNGSTDRAFTLAGNLAGGTNSAIESSGLGTLSFTSSAAIAFSNPNTAPRNLYLGGTNTGDNVFNLALGNNGSSVSTFTKQGAGKWILSGTHTYTGTTTVSEGTLQFAKQVSLYNNNTAGTGWTAANIKVAGTATLALNVGGTGEFTTGNVTTLLGNLGGANGTSTTGFAAGSAIGFDTTNVGGSFTVGDVIADSTGAGGGAIGLTKLGTGSLVLSNTNTYSGVTTVSGGKLLIDGNTSSSSAVTVANGATLGGSGTIGGTVTIQAGGTFSAGNSIQSIATGNLAQLASATFAQEIDKSVAPGVSGDLTATTGTISITPGAILTLTELGSSGAWTVGDKITLIGYSTGTWDSGLFTYLGNTLNDDTNFTFSGSDWTFNYNDTTFGDNYQSDMSGFTGIARYVTMTAVPEPRAALLGGLGLLAMLRRRRA